MTRLEKRIFLHSEFFVIKTEPLTSQVGIQEPSNNQYVQHWP